MPTFRYRAVSSSGQVVAGVGDAPTLALLHGQIEERNLTLIFAQQTEQTARATEWNPLAKRASMVQLANYSSHLAAMLAAGLPLITALEVLSTESESAPLARASSDLATAVGNGSSLSDAMREHRAVFSDLYVALVKAGEESGSLPKILARNAEFLEKQSELAGRLRDALVYPGIVAGVAVLVVAAMLAFVIPRFVELLDRVGSQLPLPTRILVFASDLLVTRWYVILAAIAVLAYLVFLAITRPRSRRWLDEWSLRVPVIGPLMLRVAAARFSRTLGTLLESGLPILASLDLVRKVLDNRFLDEEVGAVGNDVRDGETITAPLKRTRVFPQMMIQMIHVGESSGSLDQMLGRVADLYEKEVDRAAKRLSVVIEPLMIVAVGGFVSFVALALLLPMVKAIGAIGG
ncbi:MAG: type II secretion system F family protein [bacterium]